jgi:putative transposase
MTIARFCRVVALPERTYYDHRARHRTGHRLVRGPWPTPARDRARERMIEMALAFPMWGHRKIAWLCRHDGLQASDATCLRVLRAAGLVLPVDYVAEHRQLAAARREAFVTIPTRRNRVWQTDFFELETSGGGTWRCGDVTDYVTKLVLAGRSPRPQPTKTRSPPSRTPAARCTTSSAAHCWTMSPARTPARSRP